MDSEKKSGRGPLIIVIILLLLVNAVGGYFLWQGREDNKAISEERALLNNQYIAAVADLNTKQLALDTLRGRNEELDAVIDQMENRLETQKNEVLSMLRRQKLTAAELAETRALLSALNAENDVFQRRIDSVYQANRVLIAENEQLEEQLEVERQIKLQLEQDKEVLSGKVKIGKLLQPHNIVAYGIRTRSNGKEMKTNNIKKLQQLKICFDTGENKLLDEGELELFLRLINPRGETIAIESMGSGVLTLAESGEELQYSRSFEIDYAKTSKTVCVLWAENIFAAGNYQAEIYQNGHLLAQTAVELISGMGKGL